MVLEDVLQELPDSSWCTAAPFNNPVGGGGRVSEMGEGGPKVSATSDKISKSWGCNVQYGDYRYAESKY